MVTAGRRDASPHPLSKYATINTCICRPMGLSEEERGKVVTFTVDQLELQYDIRNIIDPLRYLIPTTAARRRNALAAGWLRFIASKFAPPSMPVTPPAAARS